MLELDAAAPPMSAEGEGRARFLAPVYAVDPGANGRLAAVVAYYPLVDLRPRVDPNERFPALNLSGFFLQLIASTGSYLLQSQSRSNDRIPAGA